MYCQNCGNELRQNLAFCNHCGVRVNLEFERYQSADLPAKKATVVRILSLATGLVGISGIIAVANLIYELIKRDNIPAPILLLIIIFSALIFGTVFLMLNQISRLSAAPVSPLPLIEPSQMTSDQPNNQLPPHFQTVPKSITEYTTRNLENVPREKY